MRRPEPGRRDPVRSRDRAVVTLERRADGVSLLTMCGGAGRPRLDAELDAALAAAAGEIDHDPATRAVMLRSAGRVFCMGPDPDLAPEADDEPPERADGMRLPDGVEAIAALRVPVLAVLGGDALDAGLELALAADLRVAARGVRLGLTQLSRGTIPVRGGSQRLPRLVGRAIATRMILLAERMTAAEALRRGLVQRLTTARSLASASEAIAAELAARAPVAQRFAKEALRSALDLPLREGLRLEGDLYVLLQTTRDRSEGLASFRSRRPPRFRGE